MIRCPATVQWVELDVTGHCVRPDGHTGPHRDGAWHWDAFGLRVPASVERRDQAEHTAATIIGGGQ